MNKSSEGRWKDETVLEALMDYDVRAAWRERLC
jgi:hypothetical protein